MTGTRSCARSGRRGWPVRRMPPRDVRLIEVTEDNVRAIGRLATHHSQERFVAPMAATFGDALAPTYVDGMRVVPWYRAIDADGELVGFLMIAEHTPPGDIPFLWRLLIDRRHQGRGIGTRAVGFLVDHLRDRGETMLHVGWRPGRGGPEAVLSQARVRAHRTHRGRRDHRRATHPLTAPRPPGAGGSRPRRRPGHPAPGPWPAWSRRSRPRPDTRSCG